MFQRRAPQPSPPHTTLRTLGLIAVLLTAPLLPVHAQPPSEARPASLDEVGSGEMRWTGPEGSVALPMLDLQVQLEVTGLMVHGTVTQSFRNPTSEEIEAVYSFPLPERAAVHHMEMRIGQRRIVSVIQEREEARRTYQQARDEGRKAALVEQKRPNLFKAAAANINPGESVDVILEYVQELAYDDGEFRLAFPLTLTPRYCPPDPAATAVHLVETLAAAVGGTADHGGPKPLAGAVAEAPRARLEVRLQAGFPLDEVESISHDLDTWWDGETLVIEPRGGTVAADRDFLLRWRPLLGHEPRSALFTESHHGERYALLMMLPPLEEVEAGAGLPTETLFIVDVSGSMKGPSIRQAREALLAALYRLRPDDTFNLMAFNDGLTEFAPSFQIADDDALARADRWVRRLQAGGGTEIFPALRRGVELSRLGETDRVQRIVFLTDGAVGNEDQVLRSLLGDLGPVRLHALGIGRAPNRYLMRRMADYGRGLCDFIAETADAENRVDAFLARLDRPVMTGLSLEWEGAEPLEVYPPRLPDLHAGEPLVVSARLAAGTSPGLVRLHGRVAGGPLSFDLALDESTSRDSGVATRWARAQVASLMADMHSGADRDSVRARIIEVSKRFHVITRFTSLVAVEEFPSAVDEARWVRVPNASPSAEGLAYGGTDDPLLLLLGLLLSLTGGTLLVVRRMAHPA